MTLLPIMAKFCPVDSGVGVGRPSAALVIAADWAGLYVKLVPLRPGVARSGLGSRNATKVSVSLS